MPCLKLFNISQVDIKNQMMASQNITNTQKIGVSNNEKSSNDSSLLEDSFDSEVQRKYGGEEDTSNENSSELCDSYDSEV